MKWICTRCGTVNKKNFCTKCHGSKRRFYSEYKKPEKGKSGIEEPRDEKIYRIFSEAVLIVHYLFLLVPVIKIKGVNSVRTYSALGMLYDLSLCVYIFALLALTCACIYFMEILPKIKKEVLLVAMVVNVLNFSITPALIIFGKFRHFTPTFLGIIYVIVAVLGEISLVRYYRLIFDGEDADEDYFDEDEEKNEYVKQFVPGNNDPSPRFYYPDDGYHPKKEINIEHEFVVCPMCGEKVRHGTAYCPKCNTLIHRTAPSRDIRSSSKDIRR